MIRASYDTPSSPQNINNTTILQHILFSFKAALKQSRYRWHHNLVLHKLVEILEACRLEANEASPVPSQRQAHFIRQGDQALSNTTRAWSLMTPGAEWNLMADLSQLLRFPQEITPTSIQLNIVLWSSLTKTVIIFELTIGRTEWRLLPRGRRPSMQSWQLHAHKPQLPTAEGFYIPSGGYTRTSAQHLFKSLVIRGTDLKRTIRDIATEV